MKYLMVLILLTSASLQAKHKFIAGDSTTLEVFIIDHSGKKTWSYLAPYKTQDVSILKNGNILLCTKNKVLEITMDKKIVWEFNRKGEMHSAQRLDNGNTLVGHTSEGTVLEVNSGGKVVRSFKTTFDTKVTHVNFRRVRQAASGLVYVAHHGDGVCRIYSKDGKLVSSVAHYSRKCFSATPLKDGKILLTGKDKVKLVDQEGKVYWEINTSEIKGHKIASLTSAKMLANGNILVTNWMGHEKKNKRNEVSIIEITPNKEVVWSYKDNKNKCLIAIDVFEE
jgi:outer membrane protein assembly factor BamB